MASPVPPGGIASADNMAKEPNALAGSGPVTIDQLTSLGEDGAPRLGGRTETSSPAAEPRRKKEGPSKSKHRQRSPLPNPGPRRRSSDSLADDARPSTSEPPGNRRENSRLGGASSSARDTAAASAGAGSRRNDKADNNNNSKRANGRRESVFFERSRPQLQLARSMARSHSPKVGTGATSVMLAGRRAQTRAQVKEQARLRSWVAFCRRRTVLSLDDLPKAEAPRSAKRGAVTPFCLQLSRVEGWQVPPPLVRRATQAGHSMRFSLSVSFYHAGSRRFYGNTFVGAALSEQDDDGRVVRNDEDGGSGGGGGGGKAGRRRRRSGKGAKGHKRQRRRLGRWERGEEGEPEAEELDLTTTHNDMVFWYTHFEDPNCIAVVELVASTHDDRNGVETGRFGCGWTFVQFFGPNDPGSVEHRDVYRGSPRNLLFFEQGDWSSVGDTAIPGCSFFFSLQVWDRLLDAKHLFRENELVGALDPLPGLCPRRFPTRNGREHVGPCLGYKLEDASAAGGGGKRSSSRRSRKEPIPEPIRPKLEAVVEFRLSSLRVTIPERERYERDLLRAMTDEVPEQEVLRTTTTRGMAMSKTTRQEVVTTPAGKRDLKSRIINRRVKVGFHNGHALVMPDNGWVEASLEETESPDVLRLPADVDSLVLDGLARHELFALVVVVEYTLRTRSKVAASAVAATPGGRKGDPVAAAAADLQQAALPVTVGMQAFVPFDGKRLRLRNTPRPAMGQVGLRRSGELPDVELLLAADKRIRLVSRGLVYTAGGTLGEEKYGSDHESDGDGIAGVKAVAFDLRAYDDRGKQLRDETPLLDADESDLEPANWDQRWANAPAAASSDGGGSAISTSSASSASSSEDAETSSESEASDVSEVKPPPKPRKKPSPKPQKQKLSPKRAKSPTLLFALSSDGSSKGGVSPQPGWDDWRAHGGDGGRGSLLGQSLQAPLHIEEPPKRADAFLDDYGPSAAVAGGSAPAAMELSRAARTRLGRHGFADVMRDTAGGLAPAPADGPFEAADLDIEAADPLAVHEVTLQFAGLRSPRPCMPLPESVYFTYGFWSCAPTKTERMELRPTRAKSEAPYRPDGGEGSAELRILVREKRYGRDEPSLALRHTIDTTMLQPFEAEAFAAYLATRTLFVDVWDADALLHMGTMAIPLRPLLRQQRPVAKIAREYEVIGFPPGSADAGAPAAIAYGRLSRGPVVALVQLLASNYGEVGAGGGVAACAAMEALVRPPPSGLGLDWRFGGTAPGAAPLALGGKGRPRHKVRAKPLSETNPELSKFMATVAVDRGYPSLTRPRGGVDADSLGYDELMLLVRRFRGEAKGSVRYAGPLLNLLDAPGVAALEKRLISALLRAESRGHSLEAVLKEFDADCDGLLALSELREALTLLRAWGSMPEPHVQLLLSRMADPPGSARASIVGVLAYVRARRAPADAAATAALEARLRRLLAKAELLGTSVEEAFAAFDTDGSGALTEQEFWDALQRLGLGEAMDLKRSEVRKLLKRFDVDGDGSVSLRELLAWAGKEYRPAAALENRVRKLVLKAEAGGVSLEELFGELDKDGSGHVSTAEFEEALGRIGVLKQLQRGDAAALAKRLDRDGDGSVSILEFFQFMGREWTGSSAAEARLKRVLLKAEQRGQSLEEAFGVFDADGSGELTLEEMERGLRELGVMEEVSDAQVRQVLKRVDADGSGRISIEEFLKLVGRTFTGVTSSEAKLKKLLFKAEESGTSLALAFGAFDKDGSGQITVAELELGLKGLGVFDAIPVEQVKKLLVRFDRDGDGQISLKEFMEFLGREYSETAVAEAKLRKVLLKAEEKGASLEASFAVFDKDNSNSITVAELEQALRSLKVKELDELGPRQMSLILKRFDRDGDGEVSLREFLAFAGRSYEQGDSGIERKLRKVVQKAVEQGTPVDDAFRHFDKDGNGTVTKEEFQEGLKALKIFGDFSSEEVDQVLKRFDADGDGGISLTDFMQFLGKEYHLDVGAKLHKILHKAQAMHTSPEEAFKELDRSGKGTLYPGDIYRFLQGIKPLHRVTLPEVEAFVREYGETDVSGRKAEPKMTLETFLEFSRTSEAVLRERRRSKAREEADAERRKSSDKQRAAAARAAASILTPAEVEDLLAKLKAALRDVEQKKGTSAAATFESFDYNDRGSLGTDEFTRALCSLGVLRSAPAAATAAKANAGGGPSPVVAAAGIGTNEARSIVARFDKDGDGRVSLAEFLAWYGPSASGGGGGGGKGKRHGSRVKDAEPEGKDEEKPRDTADVVATFRDILRKAEAKGARLEKVFKHLDRDGNGKLTESEVFAGLEELGVFKHLSRRDATLVLKAIDRDGDGRLDLSELLRFARGSGAAGAAKGEEQELVPTSYAFSTDPATRDAEKKLRRAVAKQIRRGLDIEGVFKRHDPGSTGHVSRPDFVQAVMELGLSLLDSRYPASAAAAAAAAAASLDDPAARRRHMAQLARMQGPVERRLIKMRLRNHHLFKDAGQSGGGGGGEAKGADSDGEEGSEALALIKWYREGQKKAMVRSVLAASLTTTARLFYAFGRPLFFEHPLRNPFSHEERFRIDVDDPELRVVTDSEEWAYLRRHVCPCVGSIGNTPIESEFLDVDPKQGIQVTLMPNETIYIPFAFLSLEPVRGGSAPPAAADNLKAASGKRAKGVVAVAEAVPDRSTIVSFISASHGHIVSMLQVHLHRRPFGVDRTFRFYQHEGEILKRCIQLLPYPSPGLPPSGTAARRCAAAANAAATASRYRSAAFLAAGAEASGYPKSSATAYDGGFNVGGGGGKFVHCVDRGSGNVVVEWRQRASSVATGGAGCGPPIDEVFIKYRVGAFPQQGDFYLLIYDDPFQASLHETWHVVVQSRLRLDAHAALGQATPVDLVVRGDRFSRRVRCYSSAPADVDFNPTGPFQLVPGAYNRAEMCYAPREAGAARIHVHMVDTDSRELVGAWLVAATAEAPVVTRSYDVDLAVGRPCHKRIAYANPWPQARLFRLASSDESVLRPRHETLEIGGGAAGYLRLWFGAPDVPGTADAFLFVNDEDGRNEECLLIRMRFS